MTRRTIKIKLKSGEYTFAERSRKDVDFNSLQERLRVKRFLFLQEKVVNEDILTAMLMSEIEKVYPPDQIISFILSDKDEQIKFIYDSFKIENEKINFEDFKKLITDEEIESTLNLINAMENETEANINESFKNYLAQNEDLTLLGFTEKLTGSAKHKLAELIYSIDKKKAEMK